MSEAIFCNACQLSVPADDKNSHYNLEWHRYNVKRKCASLPPVPRGLFESKVAALTQASSTPLVEASFSCKVCKKTFHSDAQFQQHIGTKKHKVIASAFEKSGLVADADESIVKVKAPTSSKVPAAAAAAAGAAGAAGAAEGDEDDDEDEQDADELDEDDGQDIPPTTCLFCLMQSTSMEENVQHMTEVHSFYVPWTKIGIGRVCLHCNGRGRAYHSVESVQQHMRDKGHCKILFEDDDEHEDMDEFYDFNKEMLPDGSIVTKSESTAMVVKDTPQVESVTALGEIRMSSGVVIGNRQLQRYYKQRPRPQEARESVLISTMVQRYRLLALPGYGERDYLPTHEPRARAAMRWAERNQLRVNMSTNNQKHYRNSNPM